MALYLDYALMAFCFSSINAARLLLTLYALHLSAQPVAVGLLVATFFIFPLVLSWPLGVLSDRFGARWLLLFGTLCGAGGMLVPYFVHNLPVLYVAGTLTGLAFAFYKVLLENLVGVLSKPHERAKNFSNSAVIGALTSFVGPLIAGLTIDHFSHAVSCLFVVALSLAATALLAIWGGLLPGGTSHAAAGGSVRDTLRDPAVLRILVLSCFVQVGQDFFQFYMPVYAHGVGLSASATGSVLASFSVAAFVVRFILPRLIAKLGEEMLLAYAFFFAATGFMLMPFFTHVVPLAMVAFVFGLGMGCGQPITMMLLYSRAAEGRSGETFGLRQTANNVLRLATPTLFGIIATAAGLSSVFIINALMMAAGGMLSRRGARPDSTP